jgi:hypothetical protein
MSETASPASGSAEVWITGIGLATSLGEGLDANWDALKEGRVNVDEKNYAPYVVHPLAPVNFDTQIPKKGDQRQMEAWQRIGTYAAGLALDSAGVKGNKEILSRMDMIVAAGGGERDMSVDTSILNAEAKGNSAPGLLNERLMSDLRPTLFLAQLSNLLAGNIAIVHGVCGTSRTFMGEEVAGVDATRIALARIAAGQSDIVLIGGSHNGERKDLLVLYEFGSFNLRDKFAPVWHRKEHPGFALGSAGAFLVIESEAHATARGAKPFARLTSAAGNRASSRQRLKSCGPSLAALREAAPSSPAQQAPSPPPPKNERSSPNTPISQCGPPAPGSATPWRHSFRLDWPWRRCRCHAARCFRPGIPPAPRLKCPPRRPRLWWSRRAIGGVKAWRWSRRSAKHDPGTGALCFPKFV